MRNYTLYRTCVDWPQSDVHREGGLCDMIQEARSITRETFLKHVDRGELRELEQALGYAAHPSEGLTMAGDFHVDYQRSRLHGKRVYLFKWSGIEHVFVSPDFRE